MSNIYTISGIKLFVIATIIMHTFCADKAWAQPVHVNYSKIPFATKYESSQNGTDPLISTWYNAIEKSSAGGKIVAGHVILDGSWFNDGAMMEVNKKSGVVWNKTYENGAHSALTHVVNVPGGGLIASGSTIQSALNEPWILSTQNDGTLNWSKVISNGSVSFGVDDQLDTQYNNTPSQLLAGGLGSSSSVWFGMMDNATGWLTWKKQFSYGGASSSLRLEALEKHDNGSGYIAIINHVVSGSDPSSALIVLSIDNNGNFVWAKSYQVNGFPATGNILASDVAVLPDGSFEIVGKYSLLPRGFVMRISRTGTMQWFKGFSKTEGGQLRGFAIDSIKHENNRSVISGNTLGPNTNSTSWLGVLQGSTSIIRDEVNLDVIPGNVSGSEVARGITYDGKNVGVLTERGTIYQIPHKLPKKQCSTDDYQVDGSKLSVNSSNIQLSESNPSLFILDITSSTIETNLNTLTTRQCL